MKHIARITLASLTAITLIATTAAQAKSPKKQDEATRARGLFIRKTSDAMSILVLKVTSDRTLVPVDPSNEFKAGDEIKIQFQSNFEGFIYVVNIAPNGKRRLLVPSPEATDNAVRSDDQYEFPRGSTIQFDDEKGTEVLQVIMTRGRISYLDAALTAPDQYLSDSAASAAAELQGGIAKKVTPVVPEGEGSTKVRSRDIILAPGKNKDAKGSVVAIPDNGGGGKLKAGEIAPFEIRLKHT
jgi:hypothetical protein